MDLSAWRRRWTPSGIELSLLADRGAGRVHVVPRRAPLASVRAIVGSVVSDIRARARSVHVTRAERLVTDEGELAAIVALAAETSRGWVGGRIGIVFADDFQAVIDAAFDERRAETFISFVDNLVREFPLLAERRVRRCEFTPPAGWAVKSRGLLTHVIAPTYQRDGTLLSVLPAHALHTESMLRAFVHEDVLQGVRIDDQRDEPMSFASGLAGKLLVVRGSRDDQPVEVQAVVADDQRHRYVVRLETRGSVAPDAVVLPVARSIVPVPAASTAREAGASLFTFYSD